MNPMRFGIVVTDPHDWTAGAIKTGFEKHGAKTVYLNFSQLEARIGHDVRLRCKNIDLARLDGLVVRDLGRSGSHDVAFRFEVLCTLQQQGLEMINPPAAIQRAANKFATTIALWNAGVPHPRTTVTTSLDEAREALKKYKKAVSKPLFGYKGRDLHLLTPDNHQDLEYILNKHGMVYLQEFLESPVTPRDIRVFVVGNEVAGAIYRVAPPGSWISNLSQGGAPLPCPLTEEMRDLAIRANQAVGTVYSGVDLMETSDGLKVLEVNGTPSGKGIFQAMGIDAGEMIASQAMDRIR